MKNLLFVVVFTCPFLLATIPGCNSHSIADIHRRVHERVRGRLRHVFSRIFKKDSSEEAAQCIEDLDSCNDELHIKNETLNECTDSLAMAYNDLEETTDDLNECQQNTTSLDAQLELSNKDLNECQQNVTSLKEQLRSSQQNTTILDAQLEVCNNDLIACLPRPQKTVVIGGRTPSGRTADVEVLALGESTTNCVVPDYPTTIAGHATVLYDGKLTVCGGYNGSYQASCYQLNALNNSWEEMPPMTQARSTFGAVVTPYGLMVTGGPASSGLTDTVEYFNGTAWQPLPSMPAAIARHCAVQLNSTHTAVIGGSGAGSNVYVFDWTQQKWSAVQSMQVSRYAHSCVMLPSGNVLVVGGYVANALATEEYDPMADKWVFGPSLPFTSRYGYGALVLVDEKPTLVGGAIDFSNDNRVFQLVDQKWVQLETTLQSARGSHTATQVPVESLPGCTEN